MNLAKYLIDHGKINPLLCSCFGGGASQQETAAANQSSAEATQLQNDFQQQFGEQQGFVNSFLIPQLTQMYQNPQGYGAEAIQNMEAQLINTVGIQDASAKQQAQQSFDTTNMKGLPSGVQQVALANINAAGAGTIGQGVNSINLANQQAKFTQQMTALQGLQNVPGLLGAAPQTGNLMVNANQNAFQNQNTVSQENNAANFWGNLGASLTGGLIGGGLDFLTGGLGGMASGAGFLNGGLGALGFGGQQSVGNWNSSIPFTNGGQITSPIMGGNTGPSYGPVYQGPTGSSFYGQVPS